MPEVQKISFEQFRSLVKNSGKTLRIVWKEHPGFVATLFVVFLALSFTSFFQSASIGLLVNELIASANQHVLTQNIILYTLLLLTSNVLPAFLFSTQGYISKRFWMYLEVKFDALIAQKKGELDIAIHEDPKSKDLLNRISENGIWRTQQFVDRQFYIFQNVIEVVIAAAILLHQEWWTFFVIIAGAMPGLLTGLKYGRDVWGIWGSKSETRRRYFDYRGHFESLGSITELKLFRNTKYFLRLITELYESFQNERKATERKKFISELLSIFVSQISLIVVIGFFIWQVVQGDISIGTLTFLLGSLGGFRQSLGSFFSNIGNQYADNLFVSDLFKFLSLSVVIQKPARAIRLDPKKVPTIVFENVSFKYPNTKKYVMKNFSLTITPGEKIALVGVNGAGKTTFVKLLCRFYDPTDGRITVNGHDLKDLDLDVWYSMLGAIFQDYAQYHMLVQESIRVGDTHKKANMDQTIEASKNAEAHDFISEWEHAYEQQLGKQFTEGIEPSIGQWQKLALARAFYKDPRVLILDEPTSSVDAEAEAKIFDRLEESGSNRSVVFISHRFSTVRHATRIFVIRNGEVIEQGSHEELLEKNGTYARLFRLQAKGYQ